MRRCEDAKYLKQLVRKSNVLIKDLQPSVMIRLALNYVQNEPKNPTLIYCSVPSFKQDYP